MTPKTVPQRLDCEAESPHLFIVGSNVQVNRCKLNFGLENGKLMT
jgi:hypothetical protein